MTKYFGNFGTYPLSVLFQKCVYVSIYLYKYKHECGEIWKDEYLRTSLLSKLNESCTVADISPWNY